MSSENATTGAVDSALLQMMDAVLRQHGPTERDPATGIEFDAKAWARLSAVDLTQLTIPVQAGGSGAGWPEAAALVKSAAYHAVSLPLAEGDVLAGWLLARAGLPVGPAIRTVCVLDASGRAAGVPWARHCARLAVLWCGDTGWQVADVAASAPSIAITPGMSIVGEPRDDVALDTESLAGTAVSADVTEGLMIRGALVRAVQICGALERAIELCVEHVSQRQQFGRPLAKFQAVQALLADAAAESALAATATDAAVRTAMGDGGQPDLFAVAVARSCCNHAASLVARNAHQLHGAIGTTLEHQLHRYTLAALAWRSEFGTTAYWDNVVADAAVESGAAALWELLTSVR